MSVIATAWESFSKDVIPMDAPEVQRVEMKRAFYVGAAFMMATVQSVANLPDEESGLVILQSADSELKKFMADLANEEA